MPYDPKVYLGPGWVAQLVGASSRYTKIVGSIPGWSTYENPPVNAIICGQQSDVSRTLSLQD